MGGGEGREGRRGGEGGEGGEREEREGMAKRKGKSVLLFSAMKLQHKERRVWNFR